MDKKKIKDNRTVDTKNLDDLVHEIRQFDVVDHVTSDSAGSAHWFCVRLEEEWNRDMEINIPNEVVRMAAEQRFIMEDVEAEYVRSNGKRMPVVHFYTIETIVE